MTAREKLIESLIKVRERFDEGADDWEQRLLLTFREYSRAIDIDRKLVFPIQKMLYDHIDRIRKERGSAGSGRPTTPTGKALALTVAAAAVTVLKKRGDCHSIGAALDDVAKATGIERKTIKGFRNNINSGTAPDDAIKAYPKYVAEIEKWPTLNTLNTLNDLATFLRNPP